MLVCKILCNHYNLNFLKIPREFSLFYKIPHNHYHNCLTVRLLVLTLVHFLCSNLQNDLETNLILVFKDNIPKNYLWPMLTDILVASSHIVLSKQLRHFDLSLEKWWKHRSNIIISVLNLYPFILFALVSKTVRM